MRERSKLAGKAGLFHTKEAFYTAILQPFKLRGWAEYARRKTSKTDLPVLPRTFKVILLPDTADAPTPEELSVAAVD